MPDTKRLFISIHIPFDIKYCIEEVLDPARKKLPSARFLPQENWHITLSFLGNRDEEAEENIVEAMKKVAADFSPPTVQAKTLDYGPPGSRPRMVWVYGASETLADIKTALEDEMRRLGVTIKPSRRSYKPHITLARFKDPVLRNKLPDIKTSFEQRFTAASMDLMQSHLGRGGATYNTLDVIDFSG